MVTADLFNTVVSHGVFLSRPTPDAENWTGTCPFGDHPALPSRDREGRTMTEPRDTTPGYEGTVGPTPAQYGQRHVYARDVHSGSGNCICGRWETHQMHVWVGAPEAAAQKRDDPDSWEGDTAVWSIADARTTVLLHGASTVGREIELAAESYDGSVRLTDDQATRVADALRAAATWRQK